jgi:hypothetical protein
MEELAQTTLRKKKTAERKKPTKARAKKTTEAPKDQASSSLSSDVNANNIASLAPFGSNPQSLPPISYMMAPISSTPRSTQANQSSLVTLQNFSSMPLIQCQSCFNHVQPLETTSNCYHCHTIICWNCSSKIDQNYTSCHRCRSYYTNQQQSHFNNVHYTWTG